MVAKVRTIGAQQYGAGLEWSMLDQPGRWRQHSAENAKPGQDLVTLWRAAPGQYQLGYACTRDGLSGNDRALAAALAAKLGNHWLGVFELDTNAYALIAVAETGIIMRDLVGDEQQIRLEWAAYCQEVEDFRASVGRQFVPASLQLEKGAEVKDLSTILVGGGIAQRLRGVVGQTPGQLQPIRGALSAKAATNFIPSNGKEFLWGIAALGMVLAVAGNYAWGVHKQHLIDEEAARKIAEKQESDRKAAEAAKQAAALAATQAKNDEMPAPPWLSQPLLADFVNLCSLEWKSVPISVEGWAVSASTCTNGQMVATYTRKGVATYDDFLKGVRNVFGVDAQVSKETSQTGVVSLTFQGLSPGAEQLGPARETIAALHSHFDALKVQLSLTRVLPAPKNPNEKPPELPWDEYSFTIETPLTAINTKNHSSLSLDGLDLPGLRVSSLEMARTDGEPYQTWKIKGSIYVTHGN